MVVPKKKISEKQIKIIKQRNKKKKKKKKKLINIIDMRKRNFATM